MPTNDAMQVFYGTVPLIVVLVAIFLREQTLLKDILTRLGRIEDFIVKAQQRLTQLESRAGILFHE